MHRLGPRILHTKLSAMDKETMQALAYLASFTTLLLLLVSSEADMNLPTPSVDIELVMVCVMACVNGVSLWLWWVLIAGPYLIVIAVFQS